ncbi:acyl transferase/acyl hydrolase/lysophospholipase [Schizophyllum amplum]|uniref:Acyl transferase/acyl hydrolase/lysophospholipase n=1 Tax=Schizophyllum amplum TaxID=97359 RepID=A0A550C349_9AGAR|nr:acyl transferase/acyl hydrolase/lysophospholipase [Auriculariopsis ampla]
MSMLLLLRNMLRQVEQLSHEPILPCQYFDLIAGSGTGGFIALLLGRLRLTMDEAMECYKWFIDSVDMRTKTGGNFKVAPFEEALQEISCRFGDGEDTQMTGERGPRCRTFVCVRDKGQFGVIRSKRLRTYAHPTEPPYQCTFLEAVRATMGNAVYFTPLSISNDNGTTTTFLDAGDDHYNPVYDLYDEAMSLFPSRDVAYLVSYGAGQASTIDVTPSRSLFHKPRLPPVGILEMHHLAERCDATSDAFIRNNLELQRAYYRFTHDHGFGRITSARCDQIQALVEILRSYALLVDDISLELAEKMLDERELASATRRRAMRESMAGLA